MSDQASALQKKLSAIKHRIASVDILRGLVMLLMAYDYLRDFIYYAPQGAMGYEHDSFAHFIGIWITHFCAPAFALLAGISIALQSLEGRSKKDISKYLLIRGIMLIVLELTIISFGWNFSLHAPLFLQVFFALAIGMIVMSGLIWLPVWVSAVLASMVILGHNLLDDIEAVQWGQYYGVWKVLHQIGSFEILGKKVFAFYSLLPWAFIVPAGYVAGFLFAQPQKIKERGLMFLGLIMIALFITLRLINGYGDPTPWASGISFVSTLRSFLDVTKYPASLMFLLMTLGCVFLVLGVLERYMPKWLEFLSVYGRAPLFYYILTLYISHLCVVFLGIIQGYPIYKLFGPVWDVPRGVGVGPGLLFVFWLALVITLYPLCRWYGDYRHKDRKAVLRYF